MKHANGAQVAHYEYAHTHTHTHINVMIRLVWWDDDMIPRLSFCRYNSFQLVLKK